MAAGLALEPNNFLQFQREINRFISAQLAAEPVVQQLQIDSWISPQAIDLKLLEALDRLAPFGAGNPPLVFAARELHLVDATPIGKTKEHLQMIVENSSGEQSKILWWQAAGLPQPDGFFDLAFTARSSTYKGQLQIQLEWVDFRVPEQSLTIVSSQKRKNIEVLDYREKKNNQLEAKECVSSEVYSEGTLPSVLHSKNRIELAPNDTLVIWSVPPSRQVLDGLIKSVNPRRVICFGQMPAENDLDVLLKSAAKIIKQIINQDSLPFTVQQFASHLSVTEMAAEWILRWFAARGDITMIDNKNGTLKLCRGGKFDQYSESDAKSRLQNELSEIRAFRRYYLKSELYSLFSLD